MRIHTMSSYRPYAALCVFALAFFHAALNPLTAEVELRVATLAPSGSNWMSEMEKSSMEIKDKTNGRVTVKYFPGGQQGDERDYVRKIKLGQLDGATVTSVGLSMIDESIRVLELPDMFESAEELDYVADKIWPHFQAKFKAKGFRLGARGEVGWTYFLSKNKVESLSQLRAQKAWVWGDDVIARTLFANLGMNGVPLGVPEVDAALTTGKVDMCYGSPLAAVALQWYTKIKYITSMPLNFSVGATVYWEDSINKVTAEDQKTIEEIDRASSKKIRKVARKSNEDAINTMKRRGVAVVESPAQMVTEFGNHAEQIRTTLTGKAFSKQDLDLVLRYRSDHRIKRGGKPK